MYEPTYWYRVEFYKRDPIEGVDKYSRVIYVKSKGKLPEVTDVLSTKNHLYGLQISSIVPRGAGPDLSKLTHRDYYFLCEYVETSTWEKLKYVELTPAQIAQWVEIQKREVECEDVLRRIEVEMEVLNSQKRKVITDRQKNAKKRYQIVKRDLA